MNFSRNILKPIIIILPYKFNFRTTKLFLLCEFILIDAIDERTREGFIFILCRKDISKQFFSDSGSVKISITDNVGTSNVHFSFFAGSFFKKDLDCCQVFQYNIANEFKFFIVEYFLVLVYLRSKRTKNIFDIQTCQNIKINLYTLFFFLIFLAAFVILFFFFVFKQSFV